MKSITIGIRVCMYVLCMGNEADRPTGIGHHAYSTEQTEIAVNAIKCK